MSKKLKKAIKDSFVFPESAHKDDFFNDLQPVYTEKKRTIPLIFRLTAASAALLLGFGVWNAVKIRPEHSGSDISVTEPAVTTTTSAAVSVTSVSALTTGTAVTRTSASSSQTRSSSDFSVTTTSDSITSSNTKKAAGTTVSVGITVKTTTASAPAGNSTTAVTTLTSDLISDAERSFSMKKITSFAASLIIASSNIAAPPANASGEDYMAFLREKGNLSYYTDIRENMEALASKEDELDFNADGKFDMWDVYAHFRGAYELNYNNGNHYLQPDGSDKYVPPVYTVSDKIKENVSKYGDFNHDGEVNEDDFEILTYYYSINYPVSYDFIDPNYLYYHNPDNYNDYECDELFEDKKDIWTITDLRDSINSAFEKPLIQFVLDYVEFTTRVNSGYSTFCDMIDRGLIDPDINGDGKYTISDLYDIVEGTYLCYWDDCPEYGEDSELEKYGVARNTYFTKDEWEKLKKTSLVSRAALGYSIESVQYFTAYLFEKETFKKGYADTHYFDNFRGGFFKTDMNYLIRDYLNFACPGIYNPRFDFTQDEIKDDFINYYKNVKSGIYPEPDINMNGTIEFEDYIYADLILAGDFLPDKSKYPDFPEEILGYFRHNCDFNRNEMSGDLSDVISIQLYIVKELGIPEDEVENEMARYYKKHLDIDVYDYEHYVLPEEEEAAQDTTPVPEFDGNALSGKNITAIRTYMSNIDLFIKRNGDANNDGNVDMSDAVLIMQANANPDKYKLTEEGLFNADVYSTGDGITPKDAQEIQKKLLGIS